MLFERSETSIRRQIPGSAWDVPFIDCFKMCVRLYKEWSLIEDFIPFLGYESEGFLRSETSLVQTAGRAARHEKGRVIFYANVETKSIKRTIEKTEYRRSKQIEYNQLHGIVPHSVIRPLQASLYGKSKSEESPLMVGEDDDVEAVINELTVKMDEAAAKLEFERAALLRDQIDALRSGEFGKNRKAGRRQSSYGKRYR